MARVEQYRPPKFSWGFVPEYPTSGRSCKSGLGPNQWIAKVPIMATTTDQKHFDCGFTHLIQNVGQPNDHLLLNRQACMNNIDFVSNALAGKSFSSWTDDDARNVVKASFASGQRKIAGYAFYLGQFMEAIAHKGICTPEEWQNSSFQRALWQQIQLSLDGLGFGGRAYGDYAGHFSLLRFENFGNPEQFRAALSGGQTALDVAKSAAPFGDKFYTGEEWKFRHGNIKIYQIGDIDAHHFCGAMLIALNIDKKARAFLGTDKRVCVTPHSGYNETFQPDVFSVTYSRDVPAGGKASRTTFPEWSYTHQIWLHARAIADDFDLYDWQAEERFGNNPNVLVPLDYSNFSYSGGGATHAKTSFYYTTEPCGYPPYPMGNQDITPVAVEMVGYVASWVGSKSYQFAPHKYNGQALTSVSSAYALDRYLDKKGETLLFRKGNGNEVGVLFCGTGMEPGTTAEIEIPMPTGAPLVFNAFAGVPSAFRVDLSQN